MFVLYAVLFISRLLFTPSPNCAHMVLHSAITMTYPTNFMSHKSHETLHSSYNFSAYNEFSYPYFVLIKRRQVGPRNGAIKLCWLTLYINLQLFFFCTLYNIFFFFFVIFPMILLRDYVNLNHIIICSFSIYLPLQTVFSLLSSPPPLFFHVLILPKFPNLRITCGSLNHYCFLFLLRGNCPIL